MFRFCYRQALLLCLVTAWAVAAETPGTRTPRKGRTAEAGFVGTEACTACHDDLGKAFLKTRHGLLDRDEKRGWKGMACESCHGPGQKHGEAAEPKLIFQPTKETPRVADAMCLDCHKSQATHAGRINGSHSRVQIPCTTCHPVHHEREVAPLPQTLSRTVQSQSTQLCLRCHSDTWAQLQRPHAHRVTEGAMTCVDCHNPHGTPRAFANRTTARTTNNEPGCLKCHADKRGPFVFEHAPIRLEGCQTCHDPHGSSNPRMLNQAVVSELCLDCHSNVAGRPNRTGTIGTTATGFHDLRSPVYQNCTTCHVKIHGSHVNRDFLR
jgi:DmsE family decaheme c-type cytochrome